MNFKFVVLCALALMTGSAVYGQDNVIDEVVWVVGDEAILKSEVEKLGECSVRRTVNLMVIPTVCS